MATMMATANLKRKPSHIFVYLSPIFNISRAPTPTPPPRRDQDQWPVVNSPFSLSVSVIISGACEVYDIGYRPQK